MTPVAPGSGTPSGTVTFYDGTNSIGAGSLDNTGKATLQVSSFTAGSHSITATYGGSTSFASGSTSGALVQTVSDADFTLSASTGQTITAGQTASFTITVTPSPAPYNFAVSGFGCTGLPVGTSCSFSPASVTPGDSSSTVSVTITTTARTSAAVHPKNRSSVLFAMFGAFAFGIVVIGATTGDRKALRKSMLLVALVSCGSVIACGGGGGGRTQGVPTVSGTPAGTYTITVSASGTAC